MNYNANKGSHYLEQCGSLGFAFDPLPPSLAIQDAVIESAANRDVIQWLAEWPDWPSYGLMMSGPSQSGKTHLAKYWAKRAKAVNLPLLSSSEAVTFVIDNADQWDGAMLLQSLSLIQAKGGHVLLTARQAPLWWSKQAPELRSRLLALPHVAIGQADDELLAGLMHREFQMRQLFIDEPTISWMLRNMVRHYHCISPIVGLLDDLSFHWQRTLNLGFVKEVWPSLPKEFRYENFDENHQPSDQVDALSPLLAGRATNHQPMPEANISRLFPLASEPQFL